MPIRTAINKKFLLKQLLILLPLSISGIYLATQAVRSRSVNESSSEQVAPAQATQRPATPSGRTGNPLSETPNPPPSDNPGDPFSGGNPGGGGAPAGGVPVDGGLSLLLAAGVGYGVRKAYLHRNRNIQ
jgi:hypothetical protein